MGNAAISMTPEATPAARGLSRIPVGREDMVPKAVAIREILFPTDLSEQSEVAFAHARALAEAFGASLTIYHAVEMPQHDEPHWAFDRAMDIWCRAEQLAREDLERRAAALTVAHRVLVERKVSAHRALVTLIRSSLPDLTVMATHGRAGLTHLFLGSVTEKVVQHCHRPVLCVRHGSGASAPPYRRILVPTDFSLASRKAFPFAALLARAFEAEVIALHSVPSPTVAALSGVPGPALHPPSEAALWEHFQSDFAGIPVTAQVHTGPAWDRIVQTAAVERCDLIVMATRGHDTVGDRILGSNSERVARHAPCPVLVV